MFLNTFVPTAKQNEVHTMKKEGFFVFNPLSEFGGSPTGLAVTARGAVCLLLAF